jgi:hypothetical protein
MKISYTSHALFGSVEVPDEIGLEFVHSLQKRVLMNGSQFKSTGGPGADPPARGRRRILAKDRLEVTPDIATRRLHLALSTGDRVEYEIPDSNDRVGVERLFAVIDKWAEEHNLTRGQIAGIGVRLNQSFQIWRRGPRS